MRKILLLCFTALAFSSVAQAPTGWWNESVFYEIFVRSFYDSDGDGVGDFNGMTQKLDYLNDGDPSTQIDLGVNAIWLMPINPSPSYHGYDVTDYKAVNPDYGNMADFQNFLTEAHNRGIKVIIDLVLNHSSSQHPWFIAARNGDPNYRDYYRWENSHPSYNGPWGQNVWHQNYVDGKYYYGVFWDQMPDLNFNHQPVKDSIVDIMDFWLNTVGVDGFRCDAVKYLYENGNQLEDQPQTLAYWQEFRAIMDSLKPGAVAVGEAWTNTANVVPYATNDRFNFCFEFDLASSIQHAVNNNDPLAISSQMNTVQTSYDSLQYAPFLSNHDQNRVLTEFGGDEAKMKAAAGIYLTLPGVPFIYYGEEIGMVGQGDHLNIRRPMQWNDTPPYAGFTTGTAWQGVPASYLNYNVETLGNSSESVLNYYREVVRLRTMPQSHPLHYGDFSFQFNSHQNQVLSYERKLDEPIFNGGFLIAANLSNQPVTDIIVSVSQKIQDCPDCYFFDSFSPGYTPNKSWISNNGITQVKIDSIPPMTTTITLISPPFSVSETRANDWAPYPNPADQLIAIKFEENAPTNFEIIDALGRSVKTGAIEGDRLKVEELPVGWYTLRLSNDQHAEVHKILIRR